MTTKAKKKLKAVPAVDARVKAAYARWIGGACSYPEARKEAGRPIMRVFQQLGGVETWDALLAKRKHAKKGGGAHASPSA